MSLTTQTFVGKGFMYSLQSVKVLSTEKMLYSDTYLRGRGVCTGREKTICSHPMNSWTRGLSIVGNGASNIRLPMYLVCVRVFVCVHVCVCVCVCVCACVCVCVCLCERGRE